MQATELMLCMLDLHCWLSARQRSAHVKDGSSGCQATLICLEVLCPPTSGICNKKSSHAEHFPSIACHIRHHLMHASLCVFESACFTKVSTPNCKTERFLIFAPMHTAEEQEGKRWKISNGTSIFLSIVRHYYLPCKGAATHQFDPSLQGILKLVEVAALKTKTLSAKRPFANSTAGQLSGIQQGLLQNGSR